MIHDVLSILTEEVNRYLQRRLNKQSQDKQVILGSLMNANGTPSDIGENKIICSLVNIEEEEIRQMTIKPKGVITSPPIFLNLTVLFVASFQDYQTGLKVLSEIAGFFQSKRVFTPNNTPAFSDKIEKVTLDIVNLDTRDLSSLWSMIGAKYLPSMLYKIRMIKIDQEMMTGEISTITQIEGIIQKS